MRIILYENPGEGGAQNNNRYKLDFVLFPLYVARNCISQLREDREKFVCNWFDYFTKGGEILSSETVPDCFLLMTFIFQMEKQSLERILCMYLCLMHMKVLSFIA